MEEKKYVTLEEMEELFSKETSKFELDLPIQLPEGRKLVSVPTMLGSLLERHLYAERLLRKGYQEVDWSDVCPFPSLILDFAEIWMHPLVWQNASKCKDLVIDGRVAKEEYDNERLYEISEAVYYIYEQDILAYADEPIDFDEDLPEIRFPKGMHEWSTLTWDVKSYLDKVLFGDAYDGKEMDKKYYDYVRFRYNLNIIAKHRGGKRAAEILRMLQGEWPKIKLWKTGFDRMEEKDIAEFEENLFHGFDDLLEEWEGEEQGKQTIDEKTCRYICSEKIEETGVRTVEEYTAQLSDACVNAPTLASFLEQGRGLGYLQFHGEGKSDIYNHLKECFPEKIKFGYPNFTQYFS